MAALVYHSPDYNYNAVYCGERQSSRSRMHQLMGMAMHKEVVCSFWLAGICKYSHNCRFLHQSPAPADEHHQKEEEEEDAIAMELDNDGNPNAVCKFWVAGNCKYGHHCKFLHPAKQVVCKFWLAGNCRFGDEHCKYVHAHSTGANVNFVAQLNGHQKGISGIVCSGNLLSGSQDKTIRVWDCQTGECVNVVPIGQEIGCMFGEGPWIFVGLPNQVKVWNVESCSEQSLSGPVGQVHALAIASDMLLAGVQDGNILAWKFNPTTNCLDPAKLFSGHSKAVRTLVAASGRLYSGSMDHTIKVWDLDSGQCLQTLEAHSHTVTSLLCWEEFLLSCSLDGTIKVWVATETGSLQLTYTHAVNRGVLSLCGVHDGEAKPILMCSSDDLTVRLYELPSFGERTRLFSSKEVSSIQIGPGGLIFTGDQSGQLKVWKWATSS